MSVFAARLLFGLALSATSIQASGVQDIGGILQRRQQTQFPPNNGPCPQNNGGAPLNCSDKQCVDIPLDGVCHIQTQDGFPICGCCPAFDSIACSQCGGDAGGGVCTGGGSTGIAYQGCKCESDGGGYPVDGSKVCPESNGQDTQTCSDANCGGDSKIPGVCDARTPVKDEFGKAGFFTHCACCPAGGLKDCNDCGGDAGGGKCTGLTAGYGAPYKGCKCGVGGGVDLPPPIIPIPIPPAGFPPPPPGTSNPKKECSTTNLPKCSECEGNLGWCQSGENIGCPCNEECKEDQKPKCSDESCKGDDSNKCTQGPEKDCDCDKDDECPTGDDLLACSDCGGKNDEGKCKGLEEHNNLWKDCECWDDSKPNQPYKAFNVADFAAAQARMAGLPEVGDMPASPTSSSAPSASADPSKVGCGDNSVQSVPGKLITETETIDPNTLIYRMREVICNDKCETPAGLDSSYVKVKQNDQKSNCEISVAIDGNIEAWMYRGSPSQGSQWQQCWDSTQNIINQCIKNGPNKGWWNGPDFGQYYETGFRPLNGEGSQHTPFSGDSTLHAPGSPITPTKRDGTIDCAGDSGGNGARMSDCLWPAGSAIIQDQRLDPSIQVCTSDPAKNCIKYGQNYNDRGEVLGSWCVVAQRNGCAFVIADKDPHFGGGFNGNSCITGQNLIDMSIKGGNQCAGNSPGTAIAAGPVQVNNIPAQSLCLVSDEHPEVCAVN